MCLLFLTWYYFTMKVGHMVNLILKKSYIFVMYCIILGLSSYTNGIQISKYWRKMISNAKLNIDVQEVIQTCFELSKCFSENVFWSNPKPNIDRMISPRYFFKTVGIGQYTQPITNVLNFFINWHQLKLSKVF